MEPIAQDTVYREELKSCGFGRGRGGRREEGGGSGEEENEEELEDPEHNRMDCPYFQQVG